MNDDQKEDAFQKLGEMLEAIQERSADLSEEEAVALATEAVKQVRQERRAELAKADQEP